jgi:hypothetical protein
MLVIISASCVGLISLAAGLAWARVLVEEPA